MTRATRAAAAASHAPDEPAAPPEEAPFDERALFAASRRRARAARPVPPPPPTRAELASLAERVLDVGAFAEELTRVDEGKFAIRSPVLVARDLANFAAALGLRRDSMTAAWRALAEQAAGGAPLPDNGAAALYVAVVRAAALAARGPTGRPVVIGIADARREFDLTALETCVLPSHYGGAVVGVELAAAQDLAWRKHGSRDAVLRRRAAEARAHAEKHGAIDARRAALAAALEAAGVPQHALRCVDLVGYVNHGYHAAAGVPALVERGRRFDLLDAALDEEPVTFGSFGATARTVGAYHAHVRTGAPPLAEAVATVKRAVALMRRVHAENGSRWTIETEDARGISVGGAVLRQRYFAPFLAGEGPAVEVAAARFIRRCRLRHRMGAEGLAFDEAAGSCRRFVKRGGDLEELVATMRAVNAALEAAAPAAAAPPA